MRTIKCDEIIVGSGIAGLIVALELPSDHEVTLITKKKLVDSNSFLAQGGMARCFDETDKAEYTEDTLLAGHFENNIEAVNLLIDKSIKASETLIDYGVEFTKNGNELAFTKEGGHRKSRVLYHEDITGEAIMNALIAAVKIRPNISIITYCDMQDIVIQENQCIGIVAKTEAEMLFINAKYTILSTGGMGGIYENTTSFSHIKGDAIALAIKHGIKLKDLSYIQIHPTSLYENKKGRRFLISESVRGEGAILLNQQDKRFVDELKPRDFVSNAIFNEMQKDASDFEWLNFKTVDQDINMRFPNIYNYLQLKGINPYSEYVPVTPAYHYCMGGIKVDLKGKTSMPYLLAVGEVACTGAHGKNRLASNSVLECVVFAKEAAKYIKNNPTGLVTSERDLSCVTVLTNEEKYKLIQKEIEIDKYR